MSQFRKADSSVYTVFLEMLEKVFPNLSGYSFGLLFRDAIKKSKGGLIMAEICRPTKLLSYFAKNDSGNPFDFLIIVDEMVWSCATDEDRIRLVRHELRHIDISEKGAIRLLGHDFQDFYIEVDLNADDPSWGQKLGEITMAGYGQVKDGAADPRLDRRDKDDLIPVTKDPQRQTQLTVSDGGTRGTVAGEVNAGIKKGSVIEKGKETMSGNTEAGKKGGMTLIEKKAADLKAGPKTKTADLGKKPVTVITELGKMRNKDGEIVTKVDDPEFLEGLNKGYGSL